MPEVLKTLLIVGSIYLVLFLIERKRPLRLARVPLLPRLIVNAAISTLAFTTSALMVQPVIRFLLKWTEEKSFGLLQWVDWPEPLRFILALLLLDLSFYYWHRLNHEARYLWRFHNVHHIDPDLDVTTGFRFHPGEIAFSAGFRVVQLTLLGVEGWMFLFYEIIFQAGTLFHHSNIRLPLQIERFLNLVVVTPRMHGLHHSRLRSETNSNYSVVFSIWDRLHDTLTPLPKHESTMPRIGVPGYSRPEDNSISGLLLAPVRKQSPYWQE